MIGASQRSLVFALELVGGLWRPFWACGALIEFDLKSSARDDSWDDRGEEQEIRWE